MRLPKPSTGGPMPFFLHLLLLASLAPLSTSSPLHRLASLLHLEAPPTSQAALSNATAAEAAAEGEQGQSLPRRSTCENPCGYYNQLCCPVGAACITDSAGQAQCAAAAATATTTMATLHRMDVAAPTEGSWQVYTSTWLETDLATHTAVYSSWVPLTVTAAAEVAAVACNYAAQQQSCGPKCCGSGFYCFDPSAGVCSSAANGATTLAAATGGGIVVGTVPARVTTVSGVVVTQTVAPTTTTGFLTPVSTGAINGTLVGVPQKHKGLSGGAIAGIVIGCLLAVGLLLLLCCCWIAKDCFEAVLAFFGIGGGDRRARRRTSRETIVEEDIEIERRRRRGDGRSWAGSGSADESYRSGRSYDVYSRPPGGRRPPPPRRASGGGGLGGIGTALAAGLGTTGIMRMFGGGGRQTERRTEKTSYHDGSYGSNSESWDSRGTRDSRDRRERVSSVRRTSEIRSSRRGGSSRRG